MKVETVGFIVHRAVDAKEARQIVLDVAQNHNARLIAKSKTMVSEEIHLNHALEEAGIRPVETDLGEYIVQLREEPPSHIITPAVHLRREDVGDTFHEKLGIPLTTDIPTMTDAARAARIPRSHRTICSRCKEYRGWAPSHNQKPIPFRT